MSTRDEVFRHLTRALSPTREPAFVVGHANGVLQVHVAAQTVLIEYAGTDGLVAGTKIWVRRNPDDPFGTYTYEGFRLENGTITTGGTAQGEVSGDSIAFAIDPLNDAIDALDARVTTLESAPAVPTYVRGAIVLFSLDSPIVVATDVSPHVDANQVGTLEQIKLFVKTAPTGADIIVAIKKNGTEITTTPNRARIAAGSTSGVASTFVSTAVAADDIFTMDVIQIGSSVAGDILTARIRMKLEATLS